MNLNAYWPKTATEDSIPVTAKITGTHVRQTKAKAQKAIEFRIFTSRESFSFDIPFQLEDDEWRLGLTLGNFFSNNKQKQKFRDI